MARKRPPQHRADTPGIFIPKNDSSFNLDRYEKELEKMKHDQLIQDEREAKAEEEAKKKADAKDANDPNQSK